MQIIRTKSALFLLAGVLAVAQGRVASAEDRVIDVKSCGLACKLQRNLSRDATVSVSEPLDISNGESGAVPTQDASEPLPEAADGAEHPDPAVIFAHRGQIIVESDEDRAALKRMKAKLEREITVPSSNKRTSALDVLAKPAKN